MNMVQFENGAGPIGADRIDALEKELGVRLPEQYRTFLLTHNGGTPTPNVLDINGAPFKGTSVQTLFGIDDPIESCDIRWNMQMFRDRMQDPLLAIGCDGFGHIFCIVLDGDQRGEIHYFNLDVDPPEPYFIAKDFDSFIAKLREFTPEEEATIAAGLETAKVVYSKDDE